MKCPHCGGEVSVPASTSKPEPKWRVGEDGIIYLKVVSKGTTGEEWIARLEGKGGYQVSPYAKSVLRSDDFEPTNGVTYDVAVLPGSLWSDDNRTTKNIRAEAERRKLARPNAEVSCLIRELLTDEELKKMGLWWIIAMHKPIKADGAPFLLGVDRFDGGRWLYACFGKPLRRWSRGDGFAFAVPAK